MDYNTFANDFKSKDNFIKITTKYGIVDIKALTEGWSSDKKLILTDKNGVKYLLRISNVSLYEKKKKQFEVLSRIDKLNLPCSKPIEIGCLDSENIYTLLSWVQGVSAEKAISDYSDKQAYEMGFEAGIALKNLHQVPIGKQEKSWYERYVEKAERKIKALEECEYKIDNQNFLIDYYRKNIHLMKNREVCFCHGDYHLGNMIIDNGKIGIIDFDKCGETHFVDDFKPYCWNVFKSEYFESGLIDGYFNNQVEEEFFNLLKFYTVEGCISHLPWAVKFGEREIQTAYKVINSSNKWWDNYKLDIPTWYKKI